MTYPSEAITEAANAMRLRWINNRPNLSPLLGDPMEWAADALDAATPVILAAERHRVRYLITDRRNELADQARQAHALPKAAETLALKAEMLGEVLELLREQP